MKKKDFDRICWAVEENGEKFVRHSVTHETGKVIACTGESFDVESGGLRKYWPREECEEKR